MFSIAGKSGNDELGETRTKSTARSNVRDENEENEAISPGNEI